MEFNVGGTWADAKGNQKARKDFLSAVSQSWKRKCRCNEPAAAPAAVQKPPEKTAKRQKVETASSDADEPPPPEPLRAAAIASWDAYHVGRWIMQHSKLPARIKSKTVHVPPLRPGDPFLGGLKYDVVFENEHGVSKRLALPGAALASADRTLVNKVEDLSQRNRMRLIRPLVKGVIDNILIHARDAFNDQANPSTRASSAGSTRATRTSCKSGWTSAASGCARRSEPLTPRPSRGDTDVRVTTCRALSHTFFSNAHRIPPSNGLNTRTDPSSPRTKKGARHPLGPVTGY